jgi:hypothetical protein
VEDETEDLSTLLNPPFFGTLFKRRTNKTNSRFPFPIQ